MRARVYVKCSVHLRSNLVERPNPCHLQHDVEPAPISLRRGRLLDAAAHHKAAGLPEAEALDRALADFGGPEQVRSELEATHGHRLLPVVIDKAMQWKEMTMRARWLWLSGAHLGLMVVMAVTGLLLWCGEQDTAYRYAGTVYVHDWGAWLLIVLVAGHMYLAVLHPARSV